MIKTQAELILKIREPYTLAEVKKKFASLVKDAHPDTFNIEAAVASVTDLKEARDTLVKTKGEEEAYETCKTCNGTGQVPVLGSFQFRKCVRCDGTGRVRK